jgi:hypothetical protein
MADGCGGEHRFVEYPYGPQAGSSKNLKDWWGDLALCWACSETQTLFEGVAKNTAGLLAQQAIVGRLFAQSRFVVGYVWNLKTYCI